MNFLKKVEKNKELPKAVLDDLKIRYKENNLNTKGTVLKSIRLGDSDED